MTFRCSSQTEGISPDGESGSFHQLYVKGFSFKIPNRFLPDYQLLIEQQGFLKSCQLS
jgi:hypothetical protein